MVPRTIKRGLTRLRWRERWLRLSWGLTRWAALALAALALSCLTDWLLDRYAETPRALRVGMLAAQACLWAVAAFVLVLRPFLTRLPDSRLALWVERTDPRLDHRLISTVQFHQPGARTQGMSPELIAAVTRETERLADGIHFPAVADHRRLKWSAGLALPLAALVALAVLLMPVTLAALLARQLLDEVEIPRSIYLTPATAEIWPSGEEVVLRFRVWGSAVAPDLRGTAYILPEYGAKETYELVFESMPHPGEAIYTARVRPLSLDFRYGAESLDGRTRQTGRIHFEPRPVVVRQDAWLILPSYCGRRPDGTPYEMPQPRGDIVGLRGLSARVEATIQKPVRAAELELLGTPYPDLAGPTRESAAQRHAVEAVSAASALGIFSAPAGSGSLTGTAELLAARGEVVLRRLEQKFPAGADRVRWTFDLRPTETGYRIRVVDEYGFANVPAPPRGLAVVPERPPQVALLRERFEPAKAFRLKGPEEDFEVDGMPVALDAEGRPGPIRIAYRANGPFGLGGAELRFRVLRKVEGSQDDTPRGAEHWYTLPLIERAAGAKGSFDASRGVFAESEDDEEVPFHAVTPDNPLELPRKLGGGRFEFKTSDLLDADGKRIQLRAGDQIEFYVEVFNRNPDGGAGRTHLIAQAFATQGLVSPGIVSPIVPQTAVALRVASFDAFALDGGAAVAGRSETRVKTFVPGEEFVRWALDTLQEESRLRQLEARQRGVFDRK
jgi:hypothetical protein